MRTHRSHCSRIANKCRRNAEAEEDMASLQKKGNSWNCQFVYNGKRHTFTLGDVSEREAELSAASADKVLLRLKQGLLHLPPTVDIVSFVQCDGKPPEVPRSREDITLGQLRDRYIMSAAQLKRARIARWTWPKRHARTAHMAR